MIRERKQLSVRPREAAVQRVVRQPAVSAEKKSVFTVEKIRAPLRLDSKFEPTTAA